MTLMDTVMPLRRQVIRRAAAGMLVTRVCRARRVLAGRRTLFYRWKQRYVWYGDAGLRPRPVRPRRAIVLYSKAVPANDYMSTLAEVRHWSGAWLPAPCFFPLSSVGCWPGSSYRSTAAALARDGEPQKAHGDPSGSSARHAASMGRRRGRTGVHAVP